MDTNSQLNPHSPGDKWWLWFDSTGICTFIVDQTNGKTYGENDHVVFKKEITLGENTNFSVFSPALFMGTKMENV
jgi:hypothetical protein